MEKGTARNGRVVEEDRAGGTCEIQTCEPIGVRQSDAACVRGDVGVETEELGCRCKGIVPQRWSVKEPLRMVNRTNTIRLQEGDLTFALLTASAGLISALLSVGMAYWHSKPLIS
jgi:hypothetical protein